MATKSDKPDDATNGEETDPNARYVVAKSDKAKARKWFDRAKQLVDTRSYDYAIKCYIDGLALWPEAVEEAHKPLRGCAAARQHTGGKKPGLTDRAKHPTTHKDPLKAMLNSEWLLAHDPMNVNYMEALFKNADRARCDDTVVWAGSVYRHAAENEKKPSAKRFALMKEVYEELGDRAQARGEPELAVEAFELALEALAIQKQLEPQNSLIGNLQRDLSTKLTILKGQYQTAESFTESIQDRQAQANLHDEDRMIQSHDRLAELIAVAEQEMRDNPGVPGKVNALVDLLTREDDEEQERKAIGILVELYKSGGQYRYKLRADDIRMRQLEREYREARASGDSEAAREARLRQLRFELSVFFERVKQYPTDNRIRFEYAKRLFSGRRFDDAIPLLQQARADRKHRAQCDLYLGRCFHERGYHGQAVSVLSKAVEDSEVSDDEHGKGLRYWLGRSQEADGDVAGALASFGQLLQLDYNYRDVRARMDALRKNQDQSGN